MSFPRISATRLHRNMVQLSKIGRQPGGGITRLSFSRADVEAREYVSNLIRDAGMSVSIDEFANIIGRTPGSSDGTTIACGSHIDTVPNGGLLDGAYGVVAAIEAIRSIREQATTKLALEVIVFTEEEGARFGAFIGSRGYAGLLAKKAAYALKDKDNITFAEALADANLTPKPSPHPRKHSTKIKAYLELHIEQGPVLENEHIPIGVVESIVGNGDLDIEIQGRAGHAGTTPLNLRRDALVGAARIILGVNRVARQIGGSAVATVGSITAVPGASNVVPGKAVISVDYRDSTIRRMRLLQNRITSYAKEIGRQNYLQVNVRAKDFTKPANMSPRIVRTVETSARSLGLAFKRMQSGAGHDCQNMAQFTNTGMIFVPSHKGLSHVPNEYTKPELLEAGASVLLDSAFKLANN